MKDGKRIPKEPPKDQRGRPQGGGTGLLADPVVRRLTYVSIALVLLYLIGAISVLLTGVTRKDAPRSMAERDLAVASASLTPDASGEAWAPFINALVAAGDMSKARVALSQARASAATTLPLADLDLAEARMLRLEGDHVAAANMAESAMKGYETKAKVRKAQGGSGALSEDYFNSALVRAYAMEGLGRFKDAVLMFDIYIKENPTASDILIDRGNAKLSLNDKTGAEKDFRAALKFVPYDAEAKAGLQKIGVTL